MQLERLKRQIDGLRIHEGLYQQGHVCGSSQSIERLLSFTLDHFEPFAEYNCDVEWKKGLLSHRKLVAPGAAPTRECFDSALAFCGAMSQHHQRRVAAWCAGGSPWSRRSVLKALDKPLSKHTQAIDAQLQKERERLLREIKILLVGTGKSELARQLKIFHMNGYGERERMLFKDVILWSILRGVNSLRAHAERAAATGGGVELKEENVGIRLPTDFQAAAFVVALKNNNSGDDDDDGFPLRDVLALWADPAIASAWQQQLKEEGADPNLSYFMDNVERLAANHSVPSMEDIKRVRLKTTALKEIQFASNGFTFRVVDIGGQRTERHKWMHMFDKLDVIFFCASLADYAQPELLPGEQGMLLGDHLDLFRSVVHSRWLSTANVVLFLTNKTAFAEQLRQIPLTVCFPEFTGDAQNFSQCVQHISGKFQSILEEGEAGRMISPVICELEELDMSDIWPSIREILTRNAIANSVEDHLMSGGFL